MSRKLSQILMIASFVSMIAGLVLLRLFDPYPVASLRLQVFDYYQKLMPRSVSEQWQETSPVMIVDIDEKSLAEYGQFPWSRQIMAQLVDRLTQGGIAAMGFDILFAEPDRTSPKTVIQSLRKMNYSISDQQKQGLEIIDFDENFAESIARSPVVLGQFATRHDTKTIEKRADETSVKAMLGGDASPLLVQFGGVVHNLPILERAANYRGLLSLSDEIDDVVRRVPLIVHAGGINKPALSIEMLRLAYQGNMLMLKSDPSGVSAVTLLVQGQHIDIPTDPHGRVWVYFAEPDRFNTPNNDGRMYVSASDILNGSFPPERMAGRLAIFGTSAAGLVDLRATPVNPRLPGVEVHANILENILAQDFLHYPAWMSLVELIVFSLGLVVVTLLLLKASPWISVLVFALFISSSAGASVYLYREQQMFFDASYPILCMFGMYAVVTFWRFRQNAMEKQQVRSAFGQYLSPALVEELANDPSKLTLGGEQRIMTLLFCDVRGFTSISETYRSNPEGLTRLINRLLTPLTEVILRYEGTVDKYMGDCIMAFWNAPIACPDHASFALRAANDMHIALAKLNEELAQEAREAGQTEKTINIGIGLNSGQVVVGNMGSDQRFDYSVLGDAVNLAARLEGQSKSYGVGTVVGADSHALMTEAEQANLFELDLITVKGKTQAVRIFTDLSHASSDQRQAVMVHQQVFLLAYRAQKWDEAYRLADEGQNMTLKTMSDYYVIMQERIDAYRETPPAPEWDGVYVATTK